MNKKTGILYIVATPIGNLKDITFRAVEVLKTVNCIAAEDTRHSLPLMQAYGIQTPLISLHDHNEKEKTAELLTRLQQGESMALISDAGTPLLSDPGFFLVREARILNIPVSPIPGCCAAIAALCAAGLPTDRFIFEGFLPAKTKARLDRLNALSQEPRTLVFYEAPHRILDLLEDMEKAFGPDRQVVVARELTKLFETIHSDKISKLLEWIKNDPNQQKGEFVVVVEGAVNSLPQSAVTEMLSMLLEELPLKKAVEIAAKISGERKNELYELALQIKKQST